MKVNYSYKYYLPIMLVYGILLLTIFAGIGIYNHVRKEWKVCAWCFDKFNEEGYQLEEFWYCNRCWSELRKIYFVTTQGYGMISQYRMELLYKDTKERQKRKTSQ